MPYILRNASVTTTQKAIQKHGSEIPVKNNRVDGVVKILRYRKYTYCEEVDVVFEGKIHAKLNRLPSSTWLGSEIMEKKLVNSRVSKIKVNRMIRKGILSELKNNLNYFGVSLRDYGNIKKLNWK